MNHRGQLRQLLEDLPVDILRQQEQGRKNRPLEPDWIVELGIGNGRPPIEVHVGGCYAAGKRRRPVPPDEPRRLLTSGVRACTHCKPDAQLHILD
ncbi:DUF6233 domain-containing protein [Streptomyces sp. NPDC058086]|uniref:DUF6233 domain-containing protein n=1 Tax=Streptomyces sp. NPDC058086 TaxID=3346334 RepID=UPI0036E5E4C2